MHLVTVLLAACWGANAYIVEGTVVEVNAPTELVVDHEEVKGLMGPMTMPFKLARPELADGVRRGDRVVARLIVGSDGAVLDKVRVTGHQPLPDAADDDGPPPLRPGDALPGLEVPVTGGERWTVGVGQPAPTAVAFLYTTCPLPEFCPMVVRRLQELQAEVGTDARLLAVTIDPTHDTLAVLEDYATQAGAHAATWRFGRLDPEDLHALAARAALPLNPAGDEIVHGLRLLVLDAQGRLVERYDDNRWPTSRVATQLRTGAPAAPAGSDGTLTPED